MKVIDFLLGNFRFLLNYEVLFVANHNNFHVSLAVLFDFFKPYFQIAERLFLHEVKAQDYTLSALVVGIRYGPIPLLAGSVPNLKFYFASAVIK